MKLADLVAWPSGPSKPRMSIAGDAPADVENGTKGGAASPERQARGLEAESEATP